VAGGWGSGGGVLVGVGVVCLQIVRDVCPGRQQSYALCGKKVGLNGREKIRRWGSGEGSCTEAKRTGLVAEGN